MKNDSKTPLIAIVDVQKIKYQKSNKLGIDFTNEIDVWSKMQFRSRQQIKQLRNSSTPHSHEVLNDLNSLVYAIRQKID